MDPPAVSGTRLGLLGGHSLDLATLAAISPDPIQTLDIPTEAGPVIVHDAGAFVVVHRHYATHDGFRPAHRVDHQRTIAALCNAGCDRVLALGSVGSLRTWPVGTLVAPFDFYAPNVSPSYFEDERGHNVPGFDTAWRDTVIDTWGAATATPLMDGGVYAQTAGPRFETPAEVRALAAHADIVGMTLASECILAREAALAYAAVCVVDNLGNGLGNRNLTVAEFHAGAETNRSRLLAGLREVLPALVTRPRP